MTSSKKTRDDANLTRRGFVWSLLRGLGLVAVGGAATSLAVGRRARGDKLVWQIDPFKCNKCGQCATHCVLDTSAVKCVHDFPMCGYCELCYGFFVTGAETLDEGAENQLCPLGALKRQFVEEPYYEYHVMEERCIGCGLCVKGCEQFGNSSLYLQVRHDRCLNCNECSIAAACPADAFIRLPASTPYVIRHEGPQGLLKLRGLAGK